MSALAVLRSEALYLYYTDHTAPIGGTLPKIAVSDMEVLSEEALTAAVTKFIPAVPHTSVPTVLVLGDELCFTQPFKEGDKEDAEKALIALTPFAHVATASLTVQNQRYFIATNQDYYEAVVRSLAARGHQVSLVVPWICLVRSGMTKGELDMVTVKRVFDNLSSLRMCIFPLVVENREVPVSSVTVPEKPKSKLPVGWIIFGVGALVYGFVMYWFFIRGA